jgi:hypothetical protein
MKRCGYILLAGMVLMALACSGGMTTSQTAQQTGEGPALKDNQVKGYLVSMDGKTGEITLDVDGVQKKYVRADHSKWYSPYESKIPSGNMSEAIGTDVILTVEKQDGKDMVPEARAATWPDGPSGKGNKVEGKFEGLDYKTNPDGTIHVDVNGETRDYPLAKIVRRYDASNRPLTADREIVPRHGKVLIVQDSKDGGERVTEIWGRKE